MNHLERPRDGGWSGGAAPRGCDRCRAPLPAGFVALTIAYRPAADPPGTLPASWATFRLCRRCAAAVTQWLGEAP